MFNKSDLKTLKSKIKGQILVPSYKNYREAALMFNRIIEHEPSMIVRVKSNQDIMHVIEFADKLSYPLAVRGGRHNPFGLNNEKLIIIDTQLIRDIKYNPASMQICVSSGTLISDVLSNIRNTKRSFPMGTCSSVGVVGLALGGGVGFLSRKYGLSCDSVVNIKMMTSTGEIVHIDDTNNAELFWGLRGCGSNHFGVVTSMTFNTYSIHEKIYGGTITWPLADAKEVLMRYRDLYRKADNNIYLHAIIPYAYGAEPSIIIWGVCLDTKEMGEKLFSQISKWCSPIKLEVSLTTLHDMQNIDITENFYTTWRHGLVQEHISDEMIETIISVYANCPQNMGSILFDPMGGAINGIEYGTSSFPHRTTSYICSIVGLTQDKKLYPLSRDWTKNGYALLKDYFNGGKYINYSSILESEREAMYGVSLAKLSKLKKSIDPKNMFLSNL